MILAQADLGQLPAGFLKEMILFMVAGVVVICLVVGAVIGVAMWLIEKRREQRENDAALKPSQPVSLEQPVQMQKIFPAATVRELNEGLAAHEKRLDKHDEQFADIWNHVRDEDTKIRKEMTDKFDVISRALGRIEGKLGE